MATELQKLSRKINWFCGFRLHRVSYHDLDGLTIASKTMKLIDRYNKTVKELEESIKEDYQATKKRMER